MHLKAGVMQLAADLKILTRPEVWVSPLITTLSWPVASSQVMRLVLQGNNLMKLFGKMLT